MNRTIFDKIGLPKPLAWAYLGILIFMMGDGIEQGWLSPYLIGRGLSLEQSAGLFTMYGVTIAISAWFSGVLAEAYGVKRTMFAGLVLYLLGTCGFVGLSLPGLHYPLMLATYALRGFGYPLFAYSFLSGSPMPRPRTASERPSAGSGSYLPEDSTSSGPTIPVGPSSASAISIRCGHPYSGLCWGRFSPW